MGQVGGSVALENDKNENEKLVRTQSSGPIHIEADSCYDQGGEWMIAGDSGQDAGNSGPETEGVYPAVATHGAWVKVMHVPAGMAAAGHGAHGVHGVHGVHGLHSLHGARPYTSRGLSPADMYPMNVPGGYAGQPFAMPMMYMPMPRIAPRLVPPFIDRNKSGSSGRDASRSPIPGSHASQAPAGTHEARTEVHGSKGHRDPFEDPYARRIRDPLHAVRQDGVEHQTSLDKLSVSHDAGQTGPWGQVGRPSQSSARGSSHQKPCAFFLQHGSCAFGSKCKFSHPIELAPLVEYNSVGLPRRYGQPVCRYYIQTGRCSYGYTCRYDHPDFAG